MSKGAFSSWWQIFDTNIVDKVLMLLQVIATDNPCLATISRHKHSTLWSWSLSKFHNTSIVIVPIYWMHQCVFGSSLQSIQYVLDRVLPKQRKSWTTFIHQICLALCKACSMHAGTSKSSASVSETILNRKTKISIF